MRTHERRAARKNSESTERSHYSARFMMWKSMSSSMSNLMKEKQSLSALRCTRVSSRVLCACAKCVWSA